MFEPAPNETRAEAQHPDLSVKGIQEQVERILKSHQFAKSPQLSRFLRYCVDKTLIGRADQVREQILASEVFRRPDTFDARRDPIVRVEARRLRAKLDEYYSIEGRSDPVIISFQRGEYVARFAPARLQTTPRVPSAPMRLMIVEDELVVALDLEARLRQLGYEVVGSAASGEAALVMMDHLRPDLVLMDIVLAGRMSGTEAARILWKQFKTPVVYLTGFSDAVVLDDIKDSEPYGYILKPFEPRQVHAVIQLAVSRRRRELSDANDTPIARDTLAAVLQSSGVQMWEWTVTDPAGTWPDNVAPAASPIFLAGSASAQSFLDRIVPEYREGVGEGFSKAIGSKGRIELYYPVMQDNGQVSPAVTLGLAYEDSSGRLHVIGLEFVQADPVNGVAASDSFDQLVPAGMNHPASRFQNPEA